VTLVFLTEIKQLLLTASSVTHDADTLVGMPEAVSTLLTAGLGSV